MKRPTPQDYERCLPVYSRLARQFGGGFLAFTPDKLPAGGTEMTGLRDYSPGDDPRRIEWGICARHDELRVREYGGTALRHAYILLDVSYGMLYLPVKLEAVRHILTVLSYGILDTGATLQIGLYSENFALRPPISGTKQMGTVFRLWDEIELQKEQNPPAPECIPDFQLAAEAFLALKRPVGDVFVVSDFWGVSDSFEKEFSLGFQRLKHAGFAPHVLHVTCPRDGGDYLIGDVEIIDKGRNFRQIITLTEHDLARYEKLYNEYIESVQKFCQKNEFPYNMVGTGGMIPQEMGLAVLGFPNAAICANPWQEYIE